MLGISTVQDSATGHSLKVRVYYEDTDAGGIVYYANYLKYMERARTEFLRELGYEQDQLRDIEKRLFVVKTVNVNYVVPARFNALLEVSAVPDRVARASLTFSQVVHDVTDRDSGNPETDTLVCEGQVRLACIHAETFRPAAIPAELLKRLGH